VSYLCSKKELFEDIGYVPHPLQHQVHESRAKRRVLACGVRWGKTKSAAMEAVAAALTPSVIGLREPTYGWVVAPTLGLAEKVFRVVVRVFHEKFPHRILLFRDHEMLLRVSNLGGGTAEIRGKTADNPVSLLGEGLDWVIGDEVARFKPEIWQSYLSQRLIDRKGWALLISTPKGKGWYYDVFRLGQREGTGWQSWNAPSKSNPYLDSKLIDAEIAERPDAVARQEYGAEFIEGAGQVFRNVRDLAKGEWQEPSVGEEYFAGLDLAIVTDYTVLVVLDSAHRVVYFDRFHRIDWSVQGRRLFAALERYGNPPCLIDSTGKGEPVHKELLALGICAKPYAFTNASKAALIDNLALMLERRDVVLPRTELCPELIDELESFQYSITDAGNVKTGAPVGYHDDCVIALALAAWESRTRAAFADDSAASLELAQDEQERPEVSSSRQSGRPAVELSEEEIVFRARL